MSVSGALFDMIKLLDIGKTVISKMTAEEVYNYSLIWAKEYDEELAKMLEDKEYALKVFGIERGNKKPRKDISKWSDVMYNIGYMYDDEFYGKVNEYPYQVISDKEDIAKILDLYISKYYNESDDKQTWFDKIKELDNYERESKYTVKRGDIDVNHHMHNINYLDLANEALPDEVYDNEKEFNNFKISYKKEIKLGETVKCKYSFVNNTHVICVKSEDDTKLHSVIEFLES